MIWISDVEVKGLSSSGPFGGKLEFNPGVQIISAPNAFGKSLAATSIPWCLGLEPMFGLLDDDPSCFPLAARELIDLGGSQSEVRSSSAVLGLRRHDGMGLRLERAIKGDTARVTVREFSDQGVLLRESQLSARQKTMKDETAGLQHFLFHWLGLPRVPVMTKRGPEAEVYLENIAPLLFVDQQEGWTQLQALQVHRYGQIEIEAIAVEYVLGATAAIASRLLEQSEAARVAQLKDRAEGISRDLERLLTASGWPLRWSAHGNLTEIADRWSRRTLMDALREESGVDLADRQAVLRERAEKLRAFIGRGSIDQFDTDASSKASQEVLELKAQRHALREEMRTLRLQRTEESELAESLAHRARAAGDVLRLKTEGIGRLEVVECPTCHRSIDPSSFNLTSQSAESVKAHIGALERDRALVLSNVQSIEDRLAEVQADLAAADEKLRAAERALLTVNAAVGSAREQLAAAAADLVKVEGDIDKTASTASELARWQQIVDAWIADAKSTVPSPAASEELAPRKDKFASLIREQLQVLGHSAILENPSEALSLDEDYVPYLGSRRVRALGSASDLSRLVQAYVLALAQTSHEVSGLHPGVTVLDEPLQQNPDESHRRVFIDSLVSQVGRTVPYQVILFTSLLTDEVNRLREVSAPLLLPAGRHFLQPLAPTPDSPQTGEPKKLAEEV